MKPIKKIGIFIAPNVSPAQRANPNFAKLIRLLPNMYAAYLSGGLDSKGYGYLSVDETGKSMELGEFLKPNGHMKLFQNSCEQFDKSSRVEMHIGTFGENGSEKTGADDDVWFEIRFYQSGKNTTGGLIVNYHLCDGSMGAGTPIA